MRTWEELTEEEQLISEISDLYKDVNGVRPRHYYDKSLSELKEILADLYDYAEIVFKEEQNYRDESVIEFEKVVKNTQEICGCIRSKAIEFLMDAEDVKGDYDHFCYLNNLPFTYFAGGI